MVSVLVLFQTASFMTVEGDVRHAVFSTISVDRVSVCPTQQIVSVLISEVAVLDAVLDHTHKMVNVSPFQLLTATAKNHPIGVYSVHHNVITV